MRGVGQGIGVFGGLGVSGRKSKCNWRKIVVSQVGTGEGWF